ncbi:ABC transporter substrate-binding protein [Kingella potus]|uniref:ABC transporter substrate-binding protein n=1 Tax=Kingella potus TaxID=265175 RepID=UPI002467F709|nr:ABC transporter substrate-binding protein [Kingella potus]
MPPPSRCGSSTGRTWPPSTPPLPAPSASVSSGKTPNSPSSSASFPFSPTKATRRVWKKNGGAPIGSGPYRLVKTESGRLAVFARDPAYWAAKLPSRRGMYNFDTVRLHYVRDPAVLAEGVKAGRYDFSQETSARAWARSYPETILRKRGLAKTELAHGNTAGMQGFVMNQRRPALKDIRVRRALILSFDFENINSRMMYNAYRRSPSFFTNSPMAAAGLPGADEAALLAPLKQHLPQAVFTQAAPLPPQSDPVLGIRPNLLKARQLLLEAGYRYQNGTLTDQKGEPLVLEFLIGNKLFERIIAKWQRDLAKIGITLNARTADPSVYQKRMDNFDFDLTTAVYAQSQSPGNEQAGLLLLRRRAHQRQPQPGRPLPPRRRSPPPPLRPHRQPCRTHRRRPRPRPRPAPPIHHRPQLVCRPPPRHPPHRPRHARPPAEILQPRRLGLADMVGQTARLNARSDNRQRNTARNRARAPILRRQQAV